MRAIIAGGTGFIGRALVGELKSNGWEIVVLSRSPGKVADVLGPGIMGMRWDDGNWADMLGEDSVIVNLAGENIADGRWSVAKKQRILDSRVKAGERIVNAVAVAGTMPAAVIQGSAVGLYGPRGDDTVDETTPAGDGFLAEVARKWEDSTLQLEEMGVRRAIVRTGLVLGKGGALEKMLTPFKMYMGGPLGDGLQGVSWIHIADEVGAIRFIMEHENMRGAYNLTAPFPVRFRQLARLLGEALNRPYTMRIPAFALKLILGEMAEELLLSGQLALPNRLIKAGYKFRFEQLESALAEILS